VKKPGNYKNRDLGLSVQQTGIFKGMVPAFGTGFSAASQHGRGHLKARKHLQDTWAKLMLLSRSHSPNNAVNKL
jgi:hypothetical protein